MTQSTNESIEQLKQDIRHLLAQEDVANAYIKKIIDGKNSEKRTNYFLRLAIEFLESITKNKKIEITNSSDLLNKIYKRFNSIDKKSSSKLIKNQHKHVARKFFIACFEQGIFIDKNTIDWNFFINKLNPNSSEILQIYIEKIKTLSPSKEFIETVLSFLKSKKIVKNYAKHYVNALEEIHRHSPNFDGRSIRNGLEKTKESIRKGSETPTTKYHNFNRILELFKYLQSVGTIDNNIRFPLGFDRPANETQKINPTVSSLSIHTLTGKNTLLGTKEYIEAYHLSLKENLDKILERSKKLIREKYGLFYDANLSKDPKDERGLAIQKALYDINENHNGQCHKYKISDYESSLKITKDDLLHSNGLTQSLCGALAAVITYDVGTNPWSLYNANIIAKKKNSPFIKLDPDGQVTLKVSKWRQRKIQRRTTESSKLVKSDKLSDSDINASFCMQYILEARKNHAKKIVSNNLFLYENKHRIFEVSNDASHLFKEFANKHLSNMSNIPRPSLEKIRASRAIDIYISTNGDIIKTCEYLGNKVKTALDSYIPLFLQEAIYRNKIHNFQHLYLILATCNLEDKLKILKMTNEQYNNMVKSVLNNKDFGGELYEILTPKNNKNDMEIFFICSINNFKASLLYLINNKKNETEETYRILKNAIEKAGKSNVIIQRMLIEAKKQLEADGIRI
ncbi:hypothetical protein [uncultured Tolumonas sp.]|uniref:hypothetical protein n=1 Tax=uncultured Tolumonas sp. TaxID=263765 RepID=UPI00292FD523|nr:hypothetical protein [uncultured Tolumonas sp.]